MLLLLLLWVEALVDVPSYNRRGIRSDKLSSPKMLLLKTEWTAVLPGAMRAGMQDARG